MALTTEQKAFIERLGRLAVADMKKSGVLASLTISQGILESGWGKSGLTVKGNALFGIKAGKAWKGKVYNAKTQECFDGVTYVDITAAFRAYDSWEESVADHSALLTVLPRYKAVIGEKDYKKACHAIKAAGYATAPNYAEQLINVIECYALMEYDNAATAPNNTEGMVKLKSSVFIEKLLNIANNYKTVYMWGVFGSPVTESVIAGKVKQYPDFYTAARQAQLRALIGKGYFAFDCVCLIKGIMWGWSGDASKSYGGAAYNTNGVQDVNADYMVSKCTGLSTDFSKIVPGEAVGMPGHIGVYIGGGKVVECTPIWKSGVQISACWNIGKIAGMNGRKWTRHGKLPFIEYDTATAPTEGAGGTQKPGTSNDTPQGITCAVGDVVSFTGNTHYSNANAAAGTTCKPGTAKVTSISKGAKHPYHLVKESGGGSTVYGWVDAACVTKSGTSAAPGAAMRQGARVQYSGPLYGDSLGNGPGRTVNGEYIVSRYIPDRKCGVLLGSVGWVPESACKVIS